MKFFRSTAPVLVALALFLGIVPAFASEALDPPDAYAPEAGEVLTDDAEPSAPSGDDTAVDDTPADTGAGAFGSVLSEPISVTCSGSDVTVYLDDRSYTSVVDAGGSGIPRKASDTGTLPGFLRAMFGEYTPKTQTVTTYFDGKPLETSTEYVPGIAGMDVEWIASVFLFGMVVYCLFRILGGMVR